ncbi:Ppx/GppA phosphatase family protein [Aliarcobacter vitoriensis]|uniref:Exopolyphosphatase n=1 Tax=Aliarcobacter vitoriensis TaxID=2011099 RepID=A0A366MWY2_9BACT|nr:exopolyphosphatase [Aliarcobacter vitoriensis]RBQ29922.1 exopolyphosphatase [Aliarcobacter vitoriensis]
MKDIISIDLGSNSFRVLKYDGENHKILDEYHQVVGLADGLISTGLISKEAQERVVNALKIASYKLNFNLKDAVCVTTAAMRKAKNAKEVLEYFQKQTGVNFNIINSDEEARLTLLAVKYALKREKIDSKNFILLDIGGGSTELIINKDKEFFSRSFDFGIVTMTQKNSENNSLKNDLDIRKDEVKEFLKSIDFKLQDFSFVATAGTPTTLAAIKLGIDYFNYDRNLVNGTKIYYEDLEKSLSILKTKSIEETTRLVGKGRVEFMEVGTYIYKIFFEVLNKNESIVFDDGLREGVAIDFTLKCKN